MRTGRSIPLPVNLTKEEDSKGNTVYVAVCPLNDVASQGKTKEEALANLKEALALYFEDEDAKQVSCCTEVTCISMSFNKETYSNIPKDFVKHAKAACTIGTKTSKNSC